MAIPILPKFDTLNRQVFDEVADAIITFLILPNKSQWLLSKTGEIAAKHGVSEDKLKNISKTLISFTLSSVKQKHSKEQLLTNLKNLGFTDELSESYSDKWMANSADIAKSLLTNTLAINKLVDMEWKFGVTAASSESNKVGNTFLQLKLVVNNGDELKHVYLELSLSQFYSFLHEMEKAKASMEYFG